MNMPLDLVSLCASIAFIVFALYLICGSEHDAGRVRLRQMARKQSKGVAINSPVAHRKGMLRSLPAGLLLVLPLTGHAAGFLLEDIQGNIHRLEDYRGKWVLVNFWATWCSPCLSEIPELKSLHDAHKSKDLVVIGIAMSSGSSKKVTDFSRAHDISYPVVIGNHRIAAQIGKLGVLPTSYLYSPNGEQVSYQEGEVTRESVETYIKNKKFD